MRVRSDISKGRALGDMKWTMQWSHNICKKLGKRAEMEYRAITKKIMINCKILNIYESHNLYQFIFTLDLNRFFEFHYNNGFITKSVNN